jgi:hypothetical protein
VRSGWLVVRDGRYEITPKRVRAAKQRELNHQRPTARRVLLRSTFLFGGRLGFRVPEQSACVSCCGAPNVSATSQLVLFHLYQLEKLELLHLSERSLMSLHCPFVCEAIMRILSKIIAIATIPAWIGIHADSAAAQSFDERWSIIPKAHAEPAPEAPGQTKQDPHAQPPVGEEPTRGSEDRSAHRSFNRVFSGKASYYSYSRGKTASGSSFDRNLPTAAHRSLPFGTRVRVTDPATSKSVVVRITDRGPWVRGRVLDLSLGAARSLGITDRGVAQVRAEVL